MKLKSTRAADNAGVPFKPIDPETKLEIDFGFVIRSKNCDYVRNKVREYKERLQRDRKFLAKHGGGIDMAQIDSEVTESIALCIATWTDLQDEDGNNIVYTHEAAVALMTDTGYDWLRKQIDAFSGEEANFFTSSGKTSTSGPLKSSDSKPPQIPTSLAAVA